MTLLHASMNTSAVFLPMLPAATGESPLISIGLHAVAAVPLRREGPARLSRSARAEVNLKTA